MTAEKEFFGRVRFAINDQGIACVTLTRADKHNAIDTAMFNGLIAAGEALAGTAGLRCVVLAGDGPSFCAGLDLGAMQGLLTDLNPPTMEERTHGTSNLFQKAAMIWRELPVPVIVAITGNCFGGGLQLAAAADIRVATPDACFSVMELRWGIIPDMGHFALWSGVVREDILRELTYSAREFSGEEAVNFGFATMLDADPLARSMRLAEAIAQRNPDAIRQAKVLFGCAQTMDVDAMLVAESAAQDRLLRSPNQLEAVRSQLEQRAPVYQDR